VFLVVAMVYPFKSEFMLLYAVHSCMPMAQRSPYRHSAALDRLQEPGVQVHEPQHH